MAFFVKIVEEDAEMFDESDDHTLALLQTLFKSRNLFLQVVLECIFEFFSLVLIHQICH